MDYLIIRLNRLIKRNLELIRDVVIRFIIQHIQAVADFPWIIVHECSKQPVPDGKDVAEVCVRPGALVMMVELVHVWRYKNIAQGLVEPHGEIVIAVGEVGKKDGTNTVEEIKSNGRTGDHHGDQR